MMGANIHTHTHTHTNPTLTFWSIHTRTPIFLRPIHLNGLHFALCLHMQATVTQISVTLRNLQDMGQTNPCKNACIVTTFVHLHIWL
jgi:hypothetical protein